MGAPGPDSGTWESTNPHGRSTRAVSIHVLPSEDHAKWHFLEENATWSLRFCKEQNRNRCSRTLLCGDVWFGALGAESSRKHRRRGDWSRWQCHSECNDFGKQSGVATYKVDHHDRFTRRLQVSKSTVLRLVKAPQLSGWGRLVSSRARW